MQLNLAIDKAFQLLGWYPRWDFAATIRHTVAWYRQVAPDTASPAIRGFCLDQIASYETANAPA
jgi:dTDP-D-glucose 4,6-dehydratase